MKIDFKKILLNPYSISIVVALILFLVAFHGTFSWLSSYTNHDKMIVVPDLSGLTKEEATQILEEKNLKCEVVDSIYISGKKRGAIMEQTPLAGDSIKEERTIYLIINSSSLRKVVLPDVKEVSLRQAEAIINSVGLKVDSIEYVPSEYKDLVEGVKLGRNTLESGARIPESTAVILLVGRGFADEQVDVVSFRGLTVTQSINKAHSAYLNVGDIRYDEEPKNDAEKERYIVYKQAPITGSKVKFGDPVNLYLTKDPALLEIPEEIYSDSLNTDSLIMSTVRDELWK